MVRGLIEAIGVIQFVDKAPSDRGGRTSIDVLFYIYHRSRLLVLFDVPESCQPDVANNGAMGRLKTNTRLKPEISNKQRLGPIFNL